VKFDFKVGLTSTGKASIEYKVTEAESLEEFKKVNKELEEYALNKYGHLNSTIRGEK